MLTPLEYIANLSPKEFKAFERVIKMMVSHFDIEESAAVHTVLMSMVKHKKVKLKDE